MSACPVASSGPAFLSEDPWEPHALEALFAGRVQAEEIRGEIEMTVKEILESLPEEKREMMAAFLYSRMPRHYIPTNKAPSDTPAPLPQPSLLSQAQSV